MQTRVVQRSYWAYIVRILYYYKSHVLNLDDNFHFHTIVKVSFEKAAPKKQELLAKFLEWMFNKLSHTISKNNFALAGL